MAAARDDARRVVAGNSRSTRFRCRGADEDCRTTSTLICTLISASPIRGGRGWWPDTTTTRAREPDRSLVIAPIGRSLMTSRSHTARRYSHRARPGVPAATEYWPGDAEVEMEYHAPRDIREGDELAHLGDGGDGVNVVAEWSVDRVNEQQAREIVRERSGSVCELCGRADDRLLAPASALAARRLVPGECLASMPRGPR